MLIHVSLHALMLPPLLLHHYLLLPLLPPPDVAASTGSLIRASSMDSLLDKPKQISTDKSKFDHLQSCKNYYFKSTSLSNMGAGDKK